VEKSWGSCRYDGCEKKAVLHYCLKHRDKLFGSIFEVIEKIHRISRITYIGRSHFPELRLLEHDDKEVDCLSVLHWASCHAEAIYAEEMLMYVVS